MPLTDMIIEEKGQDAYVFCMCIESADKRFRLPLQPVTRAKPRQFAEATGVTVGASGSNPNTPTRYVK